MTKPKSPLMQRFRKFMKNAKYILGLVLLALEIIQRLLDLIS